MWKIINARKIRTNIYDITIAEFKSDGTTETGRIVQKRHNINWGAKTLEKNVINEINKIKNKIDEEKSIIEQFESQVDFSSVSLEAK